jgi:hypothetical protein
MNNEWKRGLPPGKADTDKYEVYFSPGGFKWHRKKVKENDDKSVDSDNK